MFKDLTGALTDLVCTLYRMFGQTLSEYSKSVMLLCTVKFLNFRYVN